MFGRIILLFAASQLYWAWRGYLLDVPAGPSVPLRILICAVVVALHIVLFQVSLGSWRMGSSPVRLTAREVFFDAPYLWWMASSIVGFLLAMIVWIPRAIVAAARRVRASVRPDLPSPSRRAFLGRTTAVVSGAPFVAGAYGLFYGRLNLETTGPKIRLPKLPAAFEGFRIAQLSDIHIGPYMPADEIRKYAAIVNEQKADMIVLTGDFVTFDPHTARASVQALAGLRAPFGVWGCLGNHDMWTDVEDLLTAEFLKTGTRILRGENVPITRGPDSLNLIGVDFQSPRQFGPTPPPAACSAISNT